MSKSDRDVYEPLIAEIVACAEEADGGKIDAREYTERLIQAVEEVAEARLHALTRQLEDQWDWLPERLAEVHRMQDNALNPGFTAYWSGYLDGLQFAEIAARVDSPGVSTALVPRPSLGDPSTGSTEAEPFGIAPANKTHTLKCWPQFFREVVAGRKRFELRVNDRDYHVGDCLVLQEFEPFTHQFTGEMTSQRVTYMTDHLLPEGVICLSIEPWSTAAPFGIWQPIATAPKDGTLIIGALITDGKLWRVHEMKHNGLAFYTVTGGSLPRMTHWMPLPAPPTSTTEKDEASGSPVQEAER